MGLLCGSTGLGLKFKGVLWFCVALWVWEFALVQSASTVDRILGCRKVLLNWDYKRGLPVLRIQTTMFKFPETPISPISLN